MDPLIPWTSEPNTGLRSLDVLIAAGRRDPIDPLAMTEALAAYLEKQGAGVELNLHNGGHDVR